MYTGKMIAKMGKNIAKRRVTWISGAFVVVFTLASCTNNNTSIDQNGAGDNACANNASCSQGAMAGQPSVQPDSSGSRFSSTTSTSPQDSVSSAASSPQTSKPQYYSVSLASLCSSQYANQVDFQDCSDEQTAKIGQNEYSFSTAGPAYDPATDNDPPLLSLPSTTCRSLSLRFAIYPGGLPSDLRITVSVTSQGTRSVTVAPNQLGTLNTTLGRGPFEIDASANLPMGGGWGLLMDGSASCSTNSGS